MPGHRDVSWEEVQAPSRKHKGRSARVGKTRPRPAPDPLSLARGSKSVSGAQKTTGLLSGGQKEEEPRTNRARDTVDTDAELPASPAAGEIRGSLRGPHAGSMSRGAQTLGTAGPGKAHRCLRLPPSSELKSTLLTSTKVKTKQNHHLPYQRVLEKLKLFTHRPEPFQHSPWGKHGARGLCPP